MMMKFGVGGDIRRSREKGGKWKKQERLINREN
jgi:hypothetical protein